MYKKHGMYKTITYRTWTSMKARCKNPSVNRYEYYGGRGITYDTKWETFEGFYEDMGKRPSKRHQLDRIDNDGNYTKDNCRWITRSKNQRNKRLMKNNKSGYNGIAWITSRQKWLVQTRGVKAGTQKHLGQFSNLEDAIECWKKHNRENWKGEFQQ